MVIIKVVLDGVHLANVSFSQNWAPAFVNLSL